MTAPQHLGGTDIESPARQMLTTWIILSRKPYVVAERAQY
jgi:hypothetical protein